MSEFIKLTHLKSVLSEKGEEKSDKIQKKIEETTPLSEEERQLRKLLGEDDEDEEIFSVTFVKDDFQEVERTLYIRKLLIDYFYESKEGGTYLKTEQEELKVKETTEEIQKLINK